MLPEYDFSNAVRGKYYDQYRHGTNVVLLDPDVADAFPNAAAVNEALRLLVAVADAKVARHRTQAGGAKALKLTHRARRLAKSKPRPRTARG